MKLSFFTMVCVTNSYFLKSNARSKKKRIIIKSQYNLDSVMYLYLGNPSYLLYSKIQDTFLILLLFGSICCPLTLVLGGL